MERSFLRKSNLSASLLILSSRTPKMEKKELRSQYTIEKGDELKPNPDEIKKAAADRLKEFLDLYEL
jgi:hypothetical protein